MFAWRLTVITFPARSAALGVWAIDLCLHIASCHQTSWCASAWSSPKSKTLHQTNLRAYVSRNLMSQLVHKVHLNTASMACKDRVRYITTTTIRTRNSGQWVWGASCTESESLPSSLHPICHSTKPPWTLLQALPDPCLWGKHNNVHIHQQTVRNH